MLSDAAVCAGIPLVSGAAIGTEGQVTVLCGDPSIQPRVAPCYRCVYPTPPGAGNCATCAEAGVLGPVPGVIGTLQAMEAIKVITAAGTPLRGTLLCYDALSGDMPTYAVQLPPPRPDCPACGDGTDALWRFSAADPLVGLDALGCKQSAAASRPEFTVTWPRLSVHSYAAMRRDGQPHVLLDVRPAHVFQTACLHGAVNVPFKAGDSPDMLVSAADAHGKGLPIVLLCRAGNTSAAAAAALMEAGVAKVHDVEGGLIAWRTHIDASFPIA